MRKYRVTAIIAVILLVMITGACSSTHNTLPAVPKTDAYKTEPSDVLPIDEPDVEMPTSANQENNEVDSQSAEAPPVTEENTEAPPEEVVVDEATQPESTPVTECEDNTSPPPTDNEFTCTISVRCDTVLDNINRLDKEKLSIIPNDAVIFAERTVTFSEGESVFDVTLREMKNNGIHFEFTKTPMNKSAYIEGIGNLYEADCGDLSGWMYKVNGEFANYSCSQYMLKSGDKIEWVYTCNLGKDLE